MEDYREQFGDDALPDTIAEEDEEDEEASQASTEPVPSVDLEDLATGDGAGGDAAPASAGTPAAPAVTAPPQQSSATSQLATHAAPSWSTFHRRPRASRGQPTWKLTPARPQCLGLGTSAPALSSIGIIGLRSGMLVTLWRQRPGRRRQMSKYMPLR